MSRRNKLYFSKSNACSIDEVRVVRKILHTFDIEIEEFVGGTYTTEALLEADYLLILTPNRGDLSGRYEIGKGQAEQINAFKNAHGKRPIWIVSDYFESPFDSNTPSTIYVDSVRTMDVKDKNWTTQYATITSDNADTDISIYGFHRITNPLVEKFLSGDEPAGDLDIDRVKPILACSLKPKNNEKTGN